MSKKQSTLLAAIGTTEVPANHDFVVDGDWATLSLQVFTITGGTVAITATELFEKGFTLGYDAQTANYTEGRVVRGMLSGAQGTIMEDTDGGADGTLQLKKVTGSFLDNEALEEVGFSTPGKATVDGVLARVYVEGSVWATIAASAISAEAAFFNPDAGLSAGDERTHVVPRRFRLKFTEGGTLTVARFTVDLIQSGF
jgi:hypothetical protein